MRLRRFVLVVSLTLLVGLTVLWWTQQRRRDQASGGKLSASPWLELD